MKKNEKRLEELENASPLRLLFKYSWPALISMSLNALYSVVDRFYIGHGCGEAAMAGMTITFPIMLFFGAFGVFVGAGHSAVLSIKLGEGDRKTCEKLLGQLVAIKLLFFLTLTPLIFFNIDTVLGWCGGRGISHDAFNSAKTYLQIVLFSHIFSHLAFGFSAMMRAEGSAKTSMLCMVVGFGTNLILDPIFIFTFNMGIAGAAWATNIAMCASCLFASRYYLSGKSIVKLHLKRIAIYPKLLAKPCGIGFAPFLQQFLGAMINVAFPAAFTYWITDKAEATKQLASLGVFESVLILIVLPILGAQQGVQPIIGYNWGARNFRRVRKAFILGIIVPSALCFIAFVLQVIPPFPRLLSKMFVSSDNPALLDLATKDLMIANCTIWSIGINVAATTYFQAIGRPLSAIVLSTMRQGIIMLPMIIFLPFFMANKTLAIWLSLPVSDLLCAIATTLPVFLHLRFLARVRDRKEEGFIK